MTHDHRPFSHTQRYRDPLGGIQIDVVVHTRDQGVAQGYFRRTAESLGLTAIERSSDVPNWLAVLLTATLMAFVFFLLGIFGLMLADGADIRLPERILGIEWSTAIVRASIAIWLVVVVLGMLLVRGGTDEEK